MHWQQFDSSIFWYLSERMNLMLQPSQNSAVAPGEQRLEVYWKHQQQQVNGLYSPGVTPVRHIKMRRLSAAVTLCVTVRVLRTTVSWVSFLPWQNISRTSAVRCTMIIHFFSCMPGTRPAIVVQLYSCIIFCAYLRNFRFERHVVPSYLCTCW